MRHALTPRILPAAVLALACSAGTAQAIDEVATYTLQNVAFLDGAKAFGSFAFDLTTHTLSSWNIGVTPTVLLGFPIPSQTFNSLSSPFAPSYLVPGTSGFTLFNSNGRISLALTFGGTGLIGAPISDSVIHGSDSFPVPGTLFTAASGLNTGLLPTIQRTGLVGAVPEPSTLTLMLAGLVVAGATLRRRLSL